ncbi:SpoIIE family protein phosphatase [Micromonospora endolithica]|uniref:Fused response regulator/phosphatase n=1 Tax=Micromonospora endolithica TaxID=230091 RepID=A0A3A9ZIZ6_9ACTN|nr:SpoIIE family protein phosphatase [Micromonospora endolithica]RKN48323.1 fused response regulator/phosphatase [Micromonospora endolithica]TWJ24617.1 serine phosphatase RsbU (regulator of sigma subunit) [Micromonospora endolithica]
MEGGPATVLVVDDSRTKRYLLVSWLTRAGFSVLEAETGGEALARVGVDPIDLVVLDVRLPDLSGFEVCERIKAAHPAMPVVHVSAHAIDVVDRAQGLTRGADAYLAEPIEPEELVATASAVLRYYRARQRAELLVERLTGLADTTVAVHAAPSFARLLEAAAEGAAQIFKCPAAVVAETFDGDCIAGVAAGPGEAATVVPWIVDDTGVPIGSTVRVQDPAAWGLVGWPADDTVTVAAARLREDRAPLYVVVPTATQTDRNPVLVQLAQAVAAAVEAQRSYDEEHRIAVTLQRSLLPRTIPTVAGLDLAVRYEPASAQTEVGGDFYELVMLDGHLLLAIGDVAGHSLHAATVMAELRHAVRAYAVEGHQPGAILHRVNELMRTLLPDELATICVLLVHPPSGRVRMASAGHLPPALSLNGKVEYVQQSAPLLGVRAPRPPDLEFVLPAGATLVFYTDGLIERRDTTIDDGLTALAAVATRVDDDLDRFCERLLVELAPPEIHDDVAVVALRRR